MQALDLTERLLFDGGMGTMLQASGVDAGDCPELLNLTHADVVAGIHAQYAEAGARVVETNSLGGNALALARHGLADRTEELAGAAVRCARRGVGDRARVALSVGPTGGMLAPLGELTFDAVYEAYRRQIAAGADAGADLVIIETMADIAEARIALLAAVENTGLPVIMSFTYARGNRMLMGGTPASAAAISHAAGAAMIGANCSSGPEQLLPILRETRAATALPVAIQPNAGLPIVSGGVTTFPLSAGDFAAQMRPVLEAGAAAVGGCCGTTPAHIAALSAVMEGGLRQLPAPMAEPAPPLASPRQCVPVADALASLCELNGTADDLYDADPDAAAVLLDLRALTPDAIADLLDEAATALHIPLCFRVRDDAQAAAALRRYPGVAGIFGDAAGETLRRYGALPLE